MKSKLQKQEELNKAKTLLGKAQVLVFTDFTNLPAEDMRRLRRELKAVGADFLVIKKRLLNLLLKDKKIDFDVRKFKISLGTVFSEADAEKISMPVYKLFSSLNVPEGQAKDVWVKHILGGYDLKNKVAIEGQQIVYIGKLPPREVLLAQLFGMLASPIRSFMYLLDQKSKQTK
jgi:large subunit ribosomal protein L10